MPPNSDATRIYNECHRCYILYTNYGKDFGYNTDCKTYRDCLQLGVFGRDNICGKLEILIRKLEDEANNPEHTGLDC